MKNKLTMLYQALDTLTVEGYKNCKTYSNCMEFIAQMIQEIDAAEKEKPADEK